MIVFLAVSLIMYVKLHFFSSILKYTHNILITFFTPMIVDTVLLAHKGMECLLKWTKNLNA